MTCPYCNEPMACGKVYSLAVRSVYWLPQNLTPEDMGMIAIKKKIVESGGVFLDEVSQPSLKGALKDLGVLPTKRPDTYYCAHCNLLITKLEQG